MCNTFGFLTYKKKLSCAIPLDDVQCGELLPMNTGKYRGMRQAKTAIGLAQVANFMSSIWSPCKAPKSKDFVLDRICQIAYVSIQRNGCDLGVDSRKSLCRCCIGTSAVTATLRNYSRVLFQETLRSCLNVENL